MLSQQQQERTLSSQALHCYCRHQLELSTTALQSYQCSHLELHSRTDIPALLCQWISFPLLPLLSAEAKRNPEGVTTEGKENK